MLFTPPLSITVAKKSSSSPVIGSQRSCTFIPIKDIFKKKTIQSMASCCSWCYCESFPPHRFSWKFDSVVPKTAARCQAPPITTDLMFWSSLNILKQWWVCDAYKSGKLTAQKKSSVRPTGQLQTNENVQKTVRVVKNIKNRMLPFSVNQSAPHSVFVLQICLGLHVAHLRLCVGSICSTWHV